MAFNARLTRVLREVRRWRSQTGDDPLGLDPDLQPADLRRLSSEIGSVIESRGGLAIPAAPFLVGATTHLQFFHLDIGLNPLGLATSDYITATIG